MVYAKHDRGICIGQCKQLQALTAENSFCLHGGVFCFILFLRVVMLTRQINRDKHVIK